MRIGDLKKRVTIQCPNKVSDGMGGFAMTWANLGTVWAAVWPVSAKEQVTANSLSMTISHRVRIRYRSGMKSSWRLLFKGRRFDIISIVNPNEGNEYLDILCKEDAA